MKNISSRGLSDWVEPIKKTSEDAIKGWNESVKLLFVDGSHAYEDVLLDLKLWEPWVRPSGIIIMHDTKPKEYNQGVCRAMNEYLSSSHRFKERLKLLNMTVFEKISSGPEQNS